MQRKDNELVKDFILRKVSEDLELDHSLVETVISWSFKKANEAVYNKDEIELSGFGKLQLSQAKIRKYLKTLELMKSRMENNPKLPSVEKTIEEIKKRQCLTK